MPIQFHVNGHILIGLVASIVLSLLAWKLKWTTKQGMWGLLLTGVMVYVAFGWSGYLLLCLFFATAGVATRLAVRVMIRRKIAIDDEKTNPYNFTTIFLRGFIPMLSAMVLVLSGEPTTRFLCLIAFLACMATALGDTLSTDLGQAYGRRVYRLITLERVRVGTRGGVSVEGSLYGAGAIIGFAVVSMILLRLGGFSIQHYEIGLREVLIITFAAIIANHIQSTMGGIFGQFQKNPSKLLLHFIGNTIGALLAVFFTNLPEG